MPNDVTEILSKAERGYLVAAAGCGKTEEIVKAVAINSNGRQLVLTHTHAGVKSLQDRFERFGVSRRKYALDTIAGFALKYAASYPVFSGISTLMPVENEWHSVYQSALRVLQSNFGKKILQASYSGVYVDEYQDCSKTQHSLVLVIADALPTKILGDPLQGIFDFNEPIVNWEKDVAPNFKKLPDLVEPHRWNSKNVLLGKWLANCRELLISGQPISFQHAPLVWKPLSRPNQIAACFKLLNEQGIVIAIHSVPNIAHDIARTLGGKYDSMEDMACQDLLEASDRLGNINGAARASFLIEFASRCMTKVSTELRSMKERFDADQTPDVRTIRKNRNLIENLILCTQSDDLNVFLEAMQKIESIPGVSVFRKELWNEMQRTIKIYLTNNYASLREAAWYLRDLARRRGRKLEHRVVSRTIVLDADRLDAKNLYVALTRASRSLTVLSAQPEIRHPKVNWV
jgi:hypothetical protein